MKITVELPEHEIREICDLTGIRKKGPAIRKLITDSLMLRKRAEIAEKFVTGKWSAELKDYEASRAKNATTSTTLSEAWRD